MKKFAFCAILSATALLAACGGAKNDTSMEAAETMMQAMVDGDTELMNEVNHSDAYNYPTDHMISIANKRNIIGLDVSDMTFDQIDDRTVDVTVDTPDGERHFTMVFNQEKDGYFFDELQ